MPLICHIIYLSDELKRGVERYRKYTEYGKKMYMMKKDCTKRQYLVRYLRFTWREQGFIMGLNIGMSPNTDWYNITTAVCDMRERRKHVIGSKEFNQKVR